MLDEEKGNSKLQLLDLPLEDLPTSKWLEKNIDPKSKVFCISWVTFDTGKRIDLVDLGKFLKERNIFFIVDCTQGLGGLKLTKQELSYIDAISCASYKWLLGPYGHAFGYISKNAKIDVHHNSGNWITSANSTDVQSLLDYTTETIPGARKFDRGQTANLLATSCLEKSLELLLEVGLENIEEYNQNLVSHFIKNLKSENLELITPKEKPSNILCFKVIGGHTSELEQKLISNNIDVSIREGKLKTLLSPVQLACSGKFSFKYHQQLLAQE